MATEKYLRKVGTCYQKRSNNEILFLKISIQEIPFLSYHFSNNEILLLKFQFRPEFFPIQEFSALVQLLKSLFRLETRSVFE